MFRITAEAKLLPACETPSVAHELGARSGRPRCEPVESRLGQCRRTPPSRGFLTARPWPRPCDQVPEDCSKHSERWPRRRQLRKGPSVWLRFSRPLKKLGLEGEWPERKSVECVSVGGFRQETLPQFPSLPNVLGRPGLVGCEDSPGRCTSKTQWARVLRQLAEGV